jgi:hypothetical protein
LNSERQRNAALDFLENDIGSNLGYLGTFEHEFVEKPDVGNHVADDHPETSAKVAA